MTPEFVDAIELAATRFPGPFLLHWPMPGNLGGMVSFETFAEWRQFVLDMGLRRKVPEIVSAKFDRAHKLLLLGWGRFRSTQGCRADRPRGSRVGAQGPRRQRNCRPIR